MSNSTAAEAWPRLSASRSIFQYIPYVRIGLFCGLCDFILIVAASLIAGFAYNLFFWGFRVDGYADFAVGIYLASTFVLIAKALGLYRPNSLLSAQAQIRGLFIAWGAVLLMGTLLFFLFKSGEHFSRGATIVLGVLGISMILTSRVLIRANLQRALANGTLAGQRVFVIGDPEELATKSPSYLLWSYGAREVRRFELCPAKNADKATASDKELTPEDSEILNLSIIAAQIEQPERVVLALRWGDVRRRQVVCERLRALPLSVLLLPDQSMSSVLSSANNNEYLLSAMEIQRAPLSSLDVLTKRAFDFALALLLLVILSPLLLATALAIKLDTHGPVIFRQRRTGFSGRDFAIYKFRTMTVLEDGPSIRQAQRVDRRVTRVGRLLRRSSIDELPQLINVIIGNMSLVGPRPHALAHDEEFSRSIDNYAFRRYVKPGMTGWAQTHGFRGEICDMRAMHKRIEFDLWYINNWNLLLDFRILMLTGLQLLRPQNAY